MINLRKACFLLGALVATSGAVRAADSGRPAKPSKADVAVSTDLQKLIEQFNHGRDKLLADREALITQLKNATEEQRKALLERMQTEQKDLVDAQRALAKQIRDEMRKLRQTSPGSGRR